MFILINDLCNIWVGNLFSNAVTWKSGRMGGFGGGMWQTFG